MPDPITGIMAGASIIGGVKSSNSADKAANAQSQAAASEAAIAQQQIGISQQQLDMAKDQYEQYKNIYLPVEASLAAQASPDALAQQTRENVSLADRDVLDAYEKVRVARGRDMGRYGIDPSSAKYQGAMMDSYRDQAAAQAAERNKAQRAGQEAGFARQAQVAGIGRGVASTVGGMYGNAAGTLGSAASAYGNVGSTYGTMANAYSQDAASAFGSLGNVLAKSKNGGFGFGSI